jgi:hypothetical protein
MVRAGTHNNNNNNNNNSEGTNAMKNEMKKELITPTKAEQYLKKNIANRPMIKNQVDRWAGLLHEGAWRADAGTISFASDGQLIDGQHRLAGIVQAGIGAQAWVQRGCDPDSKYAIDSGRPRTRQQILAMDGVANATLINSAVALVMQYERTGRLGIPIDAPGERHRKIEHIEAHRRHDEDPEAWQEAAKLTHKSRRLLKGKVGPTSLATAAYLMLRVDEEMAVRFFNQLSDEEPACETIRALRQRLQISNCRTRGFAPRELWYFTLAWDSFITGQPIKYFPKPEALRKNKRLIQLIDAGYPFGKHTTTTTRK